MIKSDRICVCRSIEVYSYAAYDEDTRAVLSHVLLLSYDVEGSSATILLTHVCIPRAARTIYTPDW